MLKGEGEGHSCTELTNDSVHVELLSEPSTILFCATWKKRTWSSHLVIFSEFVSPTKKWTWGEGGGEWKGKDAPNSGNISTDVIRLRPDMIPSRLRQPRFVLETRVAAEELIDSEIKARVVDVQLVLADRVCGAQT
jgi:hypothetical protein